MPLTPEDRDRIFLAVLAPLKVLVVSWLGVVLLALLAYTFEATAPLLGDLTWSDAARCGTSLWLLAVGGPLSVAGAKVSLPPLLISVMVGLAMRSELRRAAVFEWREIAAASGTTLLSVAVMALFGMPGSNGPLAAFVAAFVTGLLGIGSRVSYRPFEFRGSEYVERAWHHGRSLFRFLMIVASVGAVLALVAGWPEVRTITGYYVAGGTGTAMLVLAQLAYSPTLIIWTAAYLLGFGFHIGAGTIFSAFGSTSGPLPAIPVFGAIPQPTTHLWWLTVLVALAVIAGGAQAGRRVETIREALLTSASLLGLAVVAGAALTLMAGGSIGPGRMVLVGLGIYRTLAGACLVAAVFCVGLLARVGIAVRRDSLAAQESADGATQPEAVTDASDGGEASRGDDASAARAQASVASPASATTPGAAGPLAPEVSPSPWKAEASLLDGAIRTSSRSAGAAGVVAGEQSDDFVMDGTAIDRARADNAEADVVAGDEGGHDSADEAEGDIETPGGGVGDDTNADESIEADAPHGADRADDTLDEETAGDGVDSGRRDPVNNEERGDASRAEERWRHDL